MNVKQRMISLKLLKEKKNSSEFLEEIGVAATVRVNSSEKETVCLSFHIDYRQGGNYEM